MNESIESIEREVYRLHDDIYDEKHLNTCWDLLKENDHHDGYYRQAKYLQSMILRARREELVTYKEGLGYYDQRIDQLTKEIKAKELEGIDERI